MNTSADEIWEPTAELRKASSSFVYDKSPDMLGKLYLKSLRNM
jgi:hypothetical protein